MAKKVWYNIYGDGPYDKNILLAKVKSKGLAVIVMQKLSEIYNNVRME